MISRRSVIAIGSAGGLLIALVLIGLFIVGSGDERRDGGIDRYSNRELLIPDAEYTLPPVEKELLSPGFRKLIDPDEPLDPGLVEDLQPDIGAALREAFTPEIEGELEEMLFED